MGRLAEGSTDASLIDRVRENESQAWRDLVDLYGPLIAYWCRRMGMAERLVQDCVQDVFIAVLKALETYEPRGSERGFRGWLWGITRHKCIDKVRHEGRHPRPTGGSSAHRQTQEWMDEESSELSSSDRIEIGRLFRRALDQVRAEFEEKTWQAFWRTTVDGIPAPIVAQELEISASTVRKYRSRVSRRVRLQLGETSSDESR